MRGIKIFKKSHAIFLCDCRATGKEPYVQQDPNGGGGGLSRNRRSRAVADVPCVRSRRSARRSAFLRKRLEAVLVRLSAFGCFSVVVLRFSAAVGSRIGSSLFRLAECCATFCDCLSHAQERRGLRVCAPDMPGAKRHPGDAEGGRGRLRASAGIPLEDGVQARSCRGSVGGSCRRCSLTGPDADRLRGRGPSVEDAAAVRSRTRQGVSVFWVTRRPSGSVGWRGGDPGAASGLS